MDRIVNRYHHTIPGPGGGRALSKARWEAMYDSVVYTPPNLPEPDMRYAGPSRQPRPCRVSVARAVREAQQEIRNAQI